MNLRRIYHPAAESDSDEDDDEFSDEEDGEPAPAPRRIPIAFNERRCAFFCLSERALAIIMFFRKARKRIIAQQATHKSTTKKLNALKCFRHTKGRKRR